MNDLFGNTVIEPVVVKRKPKGLFSDYDGFVDKFERKKTTDDCFTPTEVYECVLNYVRRKVDISGMEVIRPFYPDNDYMDMDYYSNQVVIDNPPFSIISKIARFYIKNKIKFFLFAPHLTLFSTIDDITRIVVGAIVKYENGAIVRTSFISNMFGDIAVIGDAELYDELERINNNQKHNTFPKYQYPKNILTVSNLHKLVMGGESLSFHKNQIKHISVLDSQKKYKKGLFGSGYLISDDALRKIKLATAKVEEAKIEATKNVFVFELSNREKNIINELNKNN